MEPLLAYTLTAWSLHRARWRAIKDRDDGAMSTELAIVTFILAGLALTIGAIVVVRAVTKANAIPTE